MFWRSVDRDKYIKIHIGWWRGAKQIPTELARWKRCLQIQPWIWIHFFKLGPTCNTSFHELVRFAAGNPIVDWYWLGCQTPNYTLLRAWIRHISGCNLVGSLERKPQDLGTFSKGNHPQHTYRWRKANYYTTCRMCLFSKYGFTRLWPSISITLHHVKSDFQLSKSWRCPHYAKTLFWESSLREMDWKWCRYRMI